MLKRLKHNFEHASFERQLLTLFVVGLSILAVVTSFATVWTTSDRVTQDFIARGITNAKSFAQQSALALLYGSEENAKEAVKMVSSFPNIEYVAIFEPSHKLLYQYGKTDKTPSIAVPGQYEGPSYWIFAEPVVVEQGPGESELVPDTAKTESQTIGYIKLKINKSELQAIKNSIIISNTLIILLLSIVLFVLIHWLLKRMTYPLHSLVETMKQREEGLQNVRVSLQGAQELYLIGQAFNNMMTALEEREAKLVQEMDARRHAEETSRQHQLQLAHFSRLKTMGELASGMAHELNQPLAAIVNYAGGCIERLQNEQVAPQITEAIQRINTQAERAGAIIHRLKDFLKKGDVTSDSIDVNEAIRGVLKLIELELKHDEIDVQLKLTENLPPADIDKTHFEQVVMNIAQNAIDAMREGQEEGLKVLTIETAKAQTHGGEVEIRINDTGPGITKEVIDKLFDPFFTTKKNGMGMGLSIVSSIVENHGGRIQAHSDLGRGAEFRLFLPIRGEK